MLDVGGATGVYAAPLAALGYDVHVVDPVPEHVAAAAEHPGVTAAVGDARELPEPDASADAVLLLGPMYHLPDRADRVRAWQEAARVVRPGGPVIGATISRFASLMDGFAKRFFADERFRPLVEGALASGRHDNADATRTWFTTAYFHRPDELPAEVADAGLTLDRIVAVESPLWLLGDRLDDLLTDDEWVATMLDMLRRVETEPSLLGASSHQLTIAYRPAD